MAYSDERATAELNMDQAQNTDNNGDHLIDSSQMPLLENIGGPLGKEKAKSDFPTSPHEKLLSAISYFLKDCPDNLTELPADFSLQLQLLEQVGEQSRRLHAMFEKQENIESQLYDIHSILNQQQEHWRENVVRSFEDVGNYIQTSQESILSGLKVLMERSNCPVPSHKKQFASDLELGGSPVAANGASSPRKVLDIQVQERHAPEVVGRAHHEDEVIVQSFESESESHEDVNVDFRRSSTSDTVKTPASVPPEIPSHCKHVQACRAMTSKIVQHPAFDAVCAVVIIANAVVISMTCERDMNHALKHLGGPEAPKDPGIEGMNFFFFVYYFIELILKLWAYGGQFFFGEDNRWNIFDFVLVITASWDMIMEHIDIIPQGGMNMTWLRLLRLLKMLKMLRVVRVLKFFSTLRMMMSSIMGSFVTLFWSCLMLALMMFIFGLCFLQSLSAHLMDTPKEHLSSETIEGISLYWSSVEQSTLTLYMAITGGNDWAQLADPIKEAGPLYYYLFIFYIAFSSIAVLNVLTGMFVDAAMKVAEQDQEDVMTDWCNRSDGEFGVDHCFRAFFQEKAEQTAALEKAKREPRAPETHITWKCIEKHFEDEGVKTFFDVLELDKEEARKIFKILQTFQDTVELNTFIAGCLRYKEQTKGIDVVALTADVQKLNRQMCLFMGFCENSFKAIHDHFALDVGVSPLRKVVTKLMLSPDEDFHVHH